MYIDLAQIHDFQDRCLLWSVCFYLQVNLANETDFKTILTGGITQTKDLSLLSKIFDWF